MPTATTQPVGPSLYTVLGLPDSSASPDNVKIAYRRSLLAHHPDKNVTHIPAFTIDHIIHAYKVLSNPALRLAYDVSRAADASAAPKCEHAPSHAGLDAVDLDDMRFDLLTATWSRACRCGNMRAFEVTETELEVLAVPGQREVIVSCADCSLSIVVCFAVADASDVE